MHSPLSLRLYYYLLNSSGKAEKTKALNILTELGEVMNIYAPFDSGIPEIFELKNMVQVAGLILEDSLRNPVFSRDQLAAAR